MNSAPAIGAAPLMAFFAAVAMIAAQVASRATRDALFLTHFEATELPPVMMGAAVVSIVSAFGFSRWLATTRPARAIPLAYALSSALTFCLWILIRRLPEVGAVALYLHVAAFGALLISGFWSVINERFDPHTARRVVPRVAAGAALGGVIGGLSAERLSALFGLPATILWMAGLQLVCAVCIWRVGPGTRVATTEPKPARPVQGLEALGKAPFLQQMAGVVALAAVLDALLDYALKAQAAKAFDDGAALIQFFAFFYTGVGLMTFLLQAAAGKPVLRRFGLAGAMGVFPVAVLSGGVLAAAATRLWTVAAVRGAAAVASNSLFRAGFELLYTPVPTETKRPAKIFVDVGAQRLGDLAGAGLVMLILLLPFAAPPVVLGLSAAVALGLLIAIRSLQRGYVAQLANSLRKGVVALDEAEVVDATTARTLAASQIAVDRQALLEQIENEHQRQLASADAPGEPPPRLATQQREAIDPAGRIPLDDGARATLLRVQALYSTDPAEVRAVLAERPGDPRVVPHVIRLLETPQVAEAAMRFLRRMAPAAVGAIVDGLVDPLQPLVVQRRLARVLEASEDLRARDGIDRALGHGKLVDSPDADALFDLRCECAQSAARMIARNAEMALPLERAIELVLRELDVDDTVWERQAKRVEGSANRSALLDGSALRRIPRNVEHMFTLLSLALDRRVLASTLAGLYSNVPQLRGTALEYLEVTLPEEVQNALRPRLGSPGTLDRVGPDGPRALGELAAELLRSATAVDLKSDLDDS